MRRLAFLLLLAGACDAEPVETPECRVCDRLELAFPELVPGEAESRSLLFRNEGDTPLRLRMLRPPGDIEPPFSTDFVCGRVCEDAEIPPGSDIELVFTFAPTEIGSFEQEVTIATSDGPGLVVRLTGSAGHPRIECDPFTMVLPLNAPEKRAPVVCRNPDDAGIVAVARIVSGEFRLADEAPFTFGPGEERRIEVVFLPHVRGEYPGELVIESDRSIELAVVPLLARVVPSVVTVGFGVGVGECIDFGEVPVGTIETRMLRATNQSDEPASVRISTEGVGFRGGSARVPAGGTVEVPISFQPFTRTAHAGSALQEGTEFGRCLRGAGI